MKKRKSQGSGPPLSHAGPQRYGMMTQQDQMRQYMEQLSTAPTQVRQTMLQQLVQQKIATLPNRSPAELAMLPKDQQNIAVSQIMAALSAEDRQALINMPPTEQALMLQKYYQQRLALSQQPMLPSIIPQPAMGAVAQNPQLSAFMAKLPPQIQLQLQSLPAEQQQRAIMQLLQQQQRQMMNPMMAAGVGGMPWQQQQAAAVGIGMPQGAMPGMMGQPGVGMAPAPMQTPVAPQPVQQEQRPPEPQPVPDVDIFLK